jgi:hypothetical protein
MPDLVMQIFNRDPITSLLGWVVFPNDFEKAAILASWRLAGALQAAPNEQVERIHRDQLWTVHDMARNYPRIAEEAEAAAYRGTQTGYLSSYLWHSWKQGTRATLEDAVRAAEKSAGKLPGVRSSLLSARTEFSKVLHFWAILSIEYGNRLPRDFRLFISRAEPFLIEMRRLETLANRGKDQTQALAVSRSLTNPAAKTALNCLAIGDL